MTLTKFPVFTGFTTYIRALQKYIICRRFRWCRSFLEVKEAEYLELTLLKYCLWSSKCHGEGKQLLRAWLDAGACSFQMHLRWSCYVLLYNLRCSWGLYMCETFRNTDETGMVSNCWSRVSSIIPPVYFVLTYWRSQSVRGLFWDREYSAQSRLDPHQNKKKHQSTNKYT
jgi:hypothetical protein